jgi:hypothetical protein
MKITLSNPKLSRPYFVRALEACSKLKVDLDTVERLRQLEHPPWTGDNMENVNTQMTTIAKWSRPSRRKD